MAWACKLKVTGITNKNNLKKYVAQSLAGIDFAGRGKKRWIYFAICDGRHTRVSGPIVYCI